MIYLQYILKKNVNVCIENTGEGVIKESNVEILSSKLCI